jgi:hypothetical protein
VSSADAVTRLLSRMSIVASVLSTTDGCRLCRTTELPQHAVPISLTSSVLRNINLPVHGPQMHPISILYTFLKLVNIPVTGRGGL